MLDQVRSLACSRNQHIVGGRGRVLVYVGMNIDYNQTVSKGGFSGSHFPLLAPVQLSGQAAATSWDNVLHLGVFKMEAGFWFKVVGRLSIGTS